MYSLGFIETMGYVPAFQVADTMAKAADVEIVKKVWVGAGLDTHESEPLALDHPLRTIDSVILTPHSAHYSSKAFETLRMHMVDQAIAVLEGTMPQFLFNREQLGL